MSRKGQEGVPDGYKRCSKCGEVKEVGEFGIDNRNPTGFQSHCHVCEKERIRSWRKNNPDKKRLANVSYKERHPEYYISQVIKEKQRKYYKEHPECNVITYLRKIGLKRPDISTQLFNSMCLQIKLIRAIKAQKEGHKEVTNG